MLVGLLSDPISGIQKKDSSQLRSLSDSFISFDSNLGACSQSARCKDVHSLNERNRSRDKHGQLGGSQMEMMLKMYDRSGNVNQHRSPKQHHTRSHRKSKSQRKHKHNANRKHRRGRSSVKQWPPLTRWDNHKLKGDYIKVDWNYVGGKHPFFVKHDLSFKLEFGDVNTHFNIKEYNQFYFRCDYRLLER